ncbi:hypothetical protein V1514DRAFT_321917 [Lipomyces japonicus]|uniref:uncharacterized protein n=1 Tax=Lipomyces japonicus TaxID=56871 RepID=UPI0034CE85EB
MPPNDNIGPTKAKKSSTENSSKMDAFRQAIDRKERVESIKENLKSMMGVYANQFDVSSVATQHAGLVNARIQLMEPHLTRTELENMLRTISIMEAPSVHLLQLLFQHLYQHSMHADIVKIAVRYLSFFDAQDILIKSLIEVMPFPDLTLLDIIRGSILSNNFEFGRVLVNDLVLRFKQNSDSRLFKFINFDKITAQSLIEKATREAEMLRLNIKQVKSLQNDASYLSLIRSEESTRGVILHLCVQLEYDEGILFWLGHGYFRGIEIALGTIINNTVNSIKVSKPLHSPDFISNLAGLLSLIIQSSQTRANRKEKLSPDILIPLASVTSHDTLIVVWKAILYGRPLSLKDNIDDVKISESNAVTSKVYRAFVNRALELKDLKSLNQIYRSAPDIDTPSELVKTMEVTLLEDDNAPQQVCEKFDWMRRKQASELLYLISSSIRQSIDTGKKRFRVVENLIMAVHGSKHQFSKKATSELASLLSEEENQNIGKIIDRYGSLFNKHQLLDIFKSVADKGINTELDNIPVIINGLRHLRNRLSSKNLEYFIRTIVQNLLNKQVDNNNSLGAINVENGTNFVIPGLRSVMQLLDRLPAIGITVSDSFQSFLLLSFISRGLYGPLLAVFQNRIPLERRVYERFQLSALASNRPEYALISFVAEREALGEPRIVFTRRLLQSAFGLLQSLTSSDDWDVRFHCARLILVLRNTLRERRRVIATQTIQDILSQGKQHVRYAIAKKRLSLSARQILDAEKFTAALQNTVWEGYEGDSLYGQLRSAARLLAGELIDNIPDLDDKQIAYIRDRSEYLRNEVAHYWNIRLWWYMDCRLILYGQETWEQRHLAFAKRISSGLHPFFSSERQSAIEAQKQVQIRASRLLRLRTKLGLAERTLLNVKSVHQVHAFGNFSEKGYLKPNDLNEEENKLFMNLLEVETILS